MFVFSPETVERVHAGHEIKPADDLVYRFWENYDFVSSVQFEAFLIVDQYRHRPPKHRINLCSFHVPVTILPRMLREGCYFEAARACLMD